MPPKIVKCSEPDCNNTLTGRQRVTCSKRCRQRRSERRKTERERAARARSRAGSQSPYEAELQDLQAAAAKGAKALLPEVMRDELRPIAREAITEDVVRGIAGMMALTPEAILTLKRQLQSDDDQVSNRAAALILRYTLGHSSVAPPPTTPAQGGMTVVFNVPQSGSDPAVEAEAIEVPADAEKVCMECSAHKHPSEFYAESDRCNVCHERITTEALERYRGVTPA